MGTPIPPPTHTITIPRHHTAASIAAIAPYRGGDMRPAADVEGERKEDGESERKEAATPRT